MRTTCGDACRNLTTTLFAFCCSLTGGCDAGLNILAMPPTGGVRVPTRPDSVRNSDPRPPNPARQPTGKPCFKLGRPSGPAQLELFQLVNDYRARKGLGRLQYSQSLELAANRFAQQMYDQNFFSHNAPDGSVPGDRAVAAGYCDPIVGENIAYGLNLMGSAGETVQSFIDSPHHNENMLLARWRYAGMGFFKITGRKGTEYWWVQLFGMDVPANAILPKVKPLRRSHEKDRKAGKAKRHGKNRRRTGSRGRRNRSHRR